MDIKTAKTLGTISVVGSAIGSEVWPIIDAVGKLTDNRKRNDARAALSLHAIAGRIAGRVLDTIPDAPGEAVGLMHDGLHLILRGAVMAATGKDPGTESRATTSAATETTVGLPSWLVM